MISDEDGRSVDDENKKRKLQTHSSAVQIKAKKQKGERVKSKIKKSLFKRGRKEFSFPISSLPLFDLKSNCELHSNEMKSRE